MKIYRFKHLLALCRAVGFGAARSKLLLNFSLPGEVDYNLLAVYRVWGVALCWQDGGRRIARSPRNPVRRSRHSTDPILVAWALKPPAPATYPKGADASHNSAWKHGTLQTHACFLLLSLLAPSKPPTTNAVQDGWLAPGSPYGHQALENAGGIFIVAWLEGFSRLGRVPAA